MPALPTGTITFLFTDVEGSTRRWEQHPHAMRGVMARHDALLTNVFEQHDGVVVRPRGEGDSLFCVFVRASDALSAALAGQRALLAEDWGVVGPLRVRMGLHTGEADLREGDYYGAAVNRCARIRAAGHGGQVLLSATTTRLVRETLPASASLLDLGEHRLRDLSEPEQIYQLEAPDLPEGFPPLKTLGARPNNLPLQLTGFVARERELAALTALLGQYRLVTLTGPGGTGKTRLALHVAADLVNEFPDGVFFVDLAPLTDPALVPSAVAQTLGVQGLPEVPPRDSVLRFLREKHLLLILDNFEHLLAAAEFTGALLQNAPRVSLLVTSRAPLRIPGEREYAVSPLPVPEAEAGSATALAENPAVQLFVLRAQAVRADFALTAENVAAVAAICARLDGLPLAIELAAARVRVLPPVSLLARLDQRLPVLIGGARTTPARQQTLRDAIGWSYALLEPAEQCLFRRLGVFAGGCTFDLAEAVCNAGGDLGLDLLDGVSSLVEKSLLRERDDPDGEPRYRMFETIREFALGELEASGEAEAVRRQLAVQVVQLARWCAAANDWTRLDVDLDNVRAVLSWCVDRAELSLGARLLWAVQSYFFNRWGLKEQRTWRLRLLALPEAALPSLSRARLLALQPVDFFSDMEPDQLATELEEAIRLSRELGDPNGLTQALRTLAFLRMTQGRWDDADPLAEEAAHFLLAANDTDAAVHVRGFRINVALARGDVASAAALLAANQTLAGKAGTGWLLSQEAELAEARGDLALARRLLGEWVQHVEVEQGTQNQVRLTGLVRLTLVALRLDDSQAAVAACVQSMEAQRTIGPSRFLPMVLSMLALAAEHGGLLSLSARLSATIAASTLKPLLNPPAMVRLQAEQQAAVARVRAALGEAAFAEAWAAGEALSADAAIEYGLDVVAQLQSLLGGERPS